MADAPAGACEMTTAIFKRLRLTLVLGGASLCAACSSMENIMPASLNAKPATVAAAQASHGGGDGSLVRLPISSQDLDCPPVDVPDTTSSLRVGGADNPSVRYQFDIAQTVRECDPAPGNQFSLKVGVSGHLAIGPAGKPGAYSAPLRITVRDENGQKLAYSKTYTVEANTGTAAETVFQFVSDPIVLPMTRTELSADYSVSVAFDNGRPAEVAHPRKRRATAHSADNAAH
jgi:hypothetical protein